MKKIIVPFIAAILVCGFANAQATQKPAAKAAKETKAVTPSKNASPVAKVATTKAKPATEVTAKPATSEKAKPAASATKPAATPRKRSSKKVKKAKTN